MPAAVVAPRRAVPGVVYTPSALTGAMVRRALAPLVAARATDLAVCDPALGEGAFALAAIDYLATATRASPRSVAERCIFGVDVDGRAVAAARDAIARATGASREVLAEHLVVADALGHAWPRRFDAVVGNPPYIRQELLADKRALRGFDVFDGVADLYVYFIELAHRLLVPGGRWCLVVPNKWLTAGYARPLRAYLARRSTVEGVVDLGRLGRTPALFDADAFPCVLWGCARSVSGPIHASVAASNASPADAIAAPGQPHPRSRWQAEPWHVDRGDDAALIDRLAARWPALRDVAGKPSRGVVTGCNAAFVVDAATRARLVAADPAADRWLRPLLKGRDLRPLRAPAVDRFVLAIDRGTPIGVLPEPLLDHLGRFRAILEPRPATHRGDWRGRKPGTYAWYELQDPLGDRAAVGVPRLFYQDIQTQPVCCIDPSGTLVPDTTVWALPSADPVLVAILSSSLYMWYARRRFPPALNGAVRPKLAYISELPIARPGDDARAALTALVERGDVAGVDAAVLELYELSAAERRRIHSG
jgi:hypothetical protein